LHCNSFGGFRIDRHRFRNVSLLFPFRALNKLYFISVYIIYGETSKILLNLHVSFLKIDARFDANRNRVSTGTNRYALRVNAKTRNRYKRAWKTWKCSRGMWHVYTNSAEGLLFSLWFLDFTAPLSTESGDFGS